MQLPPAKDMRPEATETLQTPVKELTTGSTFANRYQVIEELGKGEWAESTRLLTQISRKRWL